MSIPQARVSARTCSLVSQEAFVMRLPTLVALMFMIAAPVYAQVLTEAEIAGAIKAGQDRNSPS